MDFNKKIFLFAVFALGLNLLFADKQIGLVPSSVKNERNVFQVGVLEGDIPVLVMKEEREGFVSTITEYFVIYDKEKIGPFDDVYSPEFSPDGKNLAYSAEINGKWYLFVGKEKAGPFDYVGYLQFSPDGKTLSFRTEIDKKWYGKLFFNSKTYTGSICGGKVVYIKDDKIMLRD